MSNFYTEPFVSAGEMEFPSEPYITAQPQNHTASGPEEYVLKVIAAGAVSYQWEVFDGESWSAISGATSDTLTINIDSSMNGWRYRVLVTGADGSIVTSKAAQIAVKGVHECTLEGAVVTFTGPARITPLIADINAVQSGSGDPSPTNIRPISGWDEVNVVRTGKNLFQTMLTSQTLYGTTFTVNADGSITITGTPSSNISRVDFGTVTLPAGTYKATGCSFSGSGRVSTRLNIYNATTGTEIGRVYEGAEELEFTLAETSVVSLRPIVLTSFSGTATFYPMIRTIGNDDFEEYQGTTYPIDLGQTVYGGTLDVTSGVLTIDKTIVDLGVLSWSASSGAWLTAVPDKKTGSFNIMSSAYKVASQPYVANMNDGEMVGSANNNYMWVKDTAYETASEFKAGVSGVQLVYELATPITTQLTPTEIAALSGVNNIWADSGDISVTIIR